MLSRNPLMPARRRPKPTLVLLVRHGHTPTTGEAEERVIHLREFGPTPYAFTLKEHFPPPDVTGSGPIRSPEEWTCPA